MGSKRCRKDGFIPAVTYHRGETPLAIKVPYKEFTLMAQKARRSQVFTFKSSSKGVRLWDIAPAVLVALESGKNVKINGEDYFGEFLNPAHRFMVEIKH
jgi:hypothetical protein